jgi:hypothetical protein
MFQGWVSIVTRGGASCSARFSDRKRATYGRASARIPNAMQTLTCRGELAPTRKNDSRIKKMEKRAGGVMDQGQVSVSPQTLVQAGGQPKELKTMHHERMPFTVRIVADEKALNKAVQVRQSAYERHVPDLARRLGSPEQSDREEGSVVLLAESKLDGAALGTMRIQTNAFKPLGLESSAPLPAWLKDCSMAEATRLGVSGGIRGSVVKTMLFKAFYLYCVERHVEKMVIVARAPLDKQYEALLFDDVFAEKAFIPMAHVGYLPHRVMVFDVPSARLRWGAVGHPLYNFIFETIHPDIDLTQPGGSARPIAAGGEAEALHGRAPEPKRVD